MLSDLQPLKVISLGLLAVFGRIGLFFVCLFLLEGFECVVLCDYPVIAESSITAKPICF